MKEEKYYDQDHQRLVFLGSKASDEYWDDHWEADDFKKMIKINSNSFITKNTKRYLPEGASILEGGCGRGQNVYLLQNNGYKATGIDYASSTVEKINNYMPELDVKLDDVRKLSFDDSKFDGYWSLGVIEHFYEGYNDILLEMHRVLNTGGFLFMTVPTMSPLRKMKAKLKGYPKWEENDEQLSRFYQFALDPQLIIDTFESNGFQLVSIKPFDGVKGLKDEVSVLRKPLQYLYNSDYILNKIIRKIIGKIVERFSSHMTLFIFRKQ